MENIKGTVMVVVPAEEWAQVKATQREILEVLRGLKPQRTESSVNLKNITAMEFMAAVRIKRTKFDQLVACSKLRIIKKGRKIYVPISEVDRFFLDSSIQ